MTYWWGLLIGNWRSWNADKWWLGQVIGVADDALHVFAGLAILGLAGMLMRRPPWSWRPWFVVAIVEGLNEAYDLSRPAGVTAEAKWADSAHDFWLTLFWPTVAVLLLPRLIRRYPAPDLATDPDEI